MARKRRSKESGSEVVDYRHRNASRLNIPPAGLAARGKIVREKKIQYAYNPHLAPALRFDGTGGADRIPELLDEAKQRPLTADEVKRLQEAFRNHEPWLEWAGKRYCVADPVALHLHERISTQAILRTARRQEVQRDLFADPEQEYREAVQFYQHSMDWTNRMILGDSLAVMASLARREALAGKVQMIYMDPPYGIKYASNFQPEVGRRDVKDRDQDLTRELEMVKAYRDTWTLGVHSYLSYLRDRLLLCKELLADTGSILVQIGDENFHRVRALMDELFGVDNFCSILTFAKTGGQAGFPLTSHHDHIIWYAKNKVVMKFTPVYAPKGNEDAGTGGYDWIEQLDGMRRRLSPDERENPRVISADARLFSLGPLYSEGATSAGGFDIHFEGRRFDVPTGRHWKTSKDGVTRLKGANRLWGPRK